MLLAATEVWHRLAEHSSAGYDFDSHEAALNAAGALTLTKAGGESYENEAADLVGHAGGAAAASPVG